jgi:hypothetical protein
MDNLFEATYKCDGSSITADSQGMREMQRRVYAKWESQYLLLKAPPASGKSRALMYVALEKLRRKLVKKVIVAVPERSIGKSFASNELTQSGFHSDWIVDAQFDLCAARGDTSRTEAFRQFMSSDSEVILCTHSTLRFAFEQLNTSIFSDCLIAIDEFHHVSADVGNKLGELLRELLRDTDASILAMTGSYFRGDGVAVLSPVDEMKFSKVTYNYYEQLNGYQHLKSLGIGFHFYQGRYLDAISDILDTRKKTLIHIPNVNSSESTTEKYFEVDSIVDKIGVYHHTDGDGIIHIDTSDGRRLKIADLVNDDPADRENVISYLRRASNIDDIDIVIALGMAKEGFDWPFCETTLTVGYRGSLTEIIQIIGRCTRDSDNKSHAQFTNLIAEPDAEREEIVESINNILKAIAASLLMEEVIAPKFVFTDSEAGTGDGVHIRIKGFRPPTSERVRDIIANDITDLKAKVIQSPDIQATFPGTVDPEVIHQALIPKAIKEIYPSLNEEEVSELGDYLSASFAVNNSNMVRNDKIIRFADRLIDVAELSMDLIYSINPFSNAFDVMSKALTPRVFKAVQQCIQATRIRMTDDEAALLWPKINDFFRSTGKAPSLDSIDPLEKRMAEAHVYLRQLNAEQSA